MDKQDETENPNGKGEYEVGKGKPPKEHQFRKGKDWKGNRHGRPRGSPNFDTAMRKAFGEKLPITDPVTGRQLYGTEAMAVKLRADAIKGKAYAMRMSYEWHLKQAASAEAEQAQEMSPNHQEIIDKALQRLAKRQQKRAGDV